MDNLFWSIKSAFVFIVFQQVFKDVPQHFGVNGNCVVIGAVFIDGEVILVKELKKVDKGSYRNNENAFWVIILKKPAVEIGDFYGFAVR